MSGTIQSKFIVKFHFEVDNLIKSEEIRNAIINRLAILMEEQLDSLHLENVIKEAWISIEAKTEKSPVTGLLTIVIDKDIHTTALIAASVETIREIKAHQSKFILKEIENLEHIREAINGRSQEIVRDYYRKGKEHITSQDSLHQQDARRASKRYYNSSIASQLFNSISSNGLPTQLKDNLSNIPIMIGLILFFYTPFAISQGENNYSNSAATYGLYFLIIGVVWKIIDYLWPVTRFENMASHK